MGRDVFPDDFIDNIYALKDFTHRQLTTKYRMLLKMHRYLIHFSGFF